MIFTVKPTSQHEKVQVCHHRDDSKAVQCISGTVRDPDPDLQLDNHLTDITVVRGYGCRGLCTI